MKYQFLACSILLVSIFAHADIPKHSAMYYEAIKPEVQEAQRKGAKFKVIYHVVDDDGHPLKNQRVRYACQNDYPRKRWEGYVTTDIDGIAVVQDVVGSQMTIGVYNNNYYVSCDKIQFFGEKEFRLLSRTASGNLMGKTERW